MNKKSLIIKHQKNAVSMTLGNEVFIKRNAVSPCFFQKGLVGNKYLVWIDKNEKDEPITVTELSTYTNDWRMKVDENNAQKLQNQLLELGYIKI